MPLGGHNNKRVSLGTPSTATTSSGGGGAVPSTTVTAESETKKKDSSSSSNPNPASASSVLQRRPSISSEGSLSDCEELGVSPPAGIGGDECAGRDSR